MSTYDYYPAVLYAIEQIRQGQTITYACGLANISVQTYEKYTASHEDLQELRIEAERQSYDAMADALVNIDNHRIHGHSDPKMAKIVSDNIKWLLSKRDPSRFAERIKVDHSVTLDRVITGALERGRERAALTGPEVEGEFIDVTPDEDAALADMLS